MAIDASLQPVINALSVKLKEDSDRKSREDKVTSGKELQALDKIERALKNDKQTESLEKRIKELINRGEKNTKAQINELKKLQKTKIEQEGLRAQKDNILETQKLRNETKETRSAGKRNFDLMVQAQEKVRKQIEDSGGKVEDNQQFLKNQVRIAQERLNLRRQEIRDAAP